MKPINNRSICYLFFLVILAGTLPIGCKSTQSTTEKEQKAMRIKSKIESSDFTFNAEVAYPLRFRPIHLTSPYDLKVAKDTLKAYLPYFGRAYVAPMDPLEGGYIFTNTDFEYKYVEGKKPGNWNVTIKTYVKNRSVIMFLNVWDNGSARLVINDPDKQSISFDGYIEDNK